jgi:hypothetical protein
MFKIPCRSFQKKKEKLYILHTDMCHKTWQLLRHLVKLSTKVHSDNMSLSWYSNIKIFTVQPLLSCLFTFAPASHNLFITLTRPSLEAYINGDVWYLKEQHLPLFLQHENWILNYSTNSILNKLNKILLFKKVVSIILLYNFIQHLRRIIKLL